jgi:hypothetical protein
MTDAKNPWQFVTNSNGNTVSSLMEEFAAVRSTLRKAMEAAQHVTVHGRNYQTLPDAERHPALDTDRNLRKQMIETLLEVDALAMKAQLRLLDQKP